MAFFLFITLYQVDNAVPTFLKMTDTPKTTTNQEVQENDTAVGNLRDKASDVKEIRKKEKAPLRSVVVEKTKIPQNATLYQLASLSV